MSGKWVVIEGMEACGKGTLRNGLADEWDEDIRGNIVFVREPGGTPFGEQVRNLLLHSRDAATVPMAETLLFFAARTQLIADVIIPALAAGKLVVSERNWVSSWVMQGMDDAQQAQVGALIGMLNDTFGVNPDLYLYLDIDLETSLTRKTARGGLDNIEQRGEEYFAQVLAGYRKWAAEQFVWTGSEVIDTPVVVIDGEQSPEAVLSQAVNAIYKLYD